VNSAGAVTTTTSYDAYGEQNGGNGAGPGGFGFAGEQTDSTTGLQYLRARYYDPRNDTFISRDPMSVGPGLTGHPYSYGNDNPVMNTDPMGLCPWGMFCSPHAFVRDWVSMAQSWSAWGSLGNGWLSSSLHSIRDSFMAQIERLGAAQMAEAAGYRTLVDAMNACAGDRACTLEVVTGMAVVGVALVIFPVTGTAGTVIGFVMVFSGYGWSVWNRFATAPDDSAERQPGASRRNASRGLLGGGVDVMDLGGNQYG